MAQTQEEIQAYEEVKKVMLESLERIDALLDEGDFMEAAVMFKGLSDIFQKQAGMCVLFHISGGNDAEMFKILRDLKSALEEDADE